MIIHDFFDTVILIVANKPLISTFIICFNEGHQIERTLKSLSFSDEIIIVDSGSTDDTVEVCKKYTDKIFIKPWAGFVEQKEYGLSLCSHEWVFNIDADEVVTAELATEMLSSVEENEYDGFFINRVVYHLGKWWRKGLWYPEYRMRLFRKSKTRWEGTDPHEKAVVNGKTKRLKGELLHYTYKDLHDQILRLNRYSTTLAENAIREGKKTNVIEIIFRPQFRFLKMYFLKKGFLEGFPGFIVSMLEAWYVFVKYSKQWEMQNRKDS